MCSTLITALWSAAATAHTNFWSCTMLNCFKRSVQTPAPLAPMPPRELLTPALIKNAFLPPSTTTMLTAKRRDKPDVAAAAASNRAHLHHRILPRPFCSSGNVRRRRAPPQTTFSPLPPALNCVSVSCVRSQWRPRILTPAPATSRLLTAV